MKSALLERYLKDIRPKLKKELGLDNVMEVPRVTKICVNVGMGSYLQKFGGKNYEFVQKNLEAITGQKVVVRNAKKSVSNFKVREGNPVGLSVTLRGASAYNFLEKMIHIVYPRVRDFRGVSTKTFDKAGNCSVGFPDHTVFPEGVLPEDSRRIHGIQVTIVTNAKNAERGRKLLESFDFPFKK